MRHLKNVLAPSRNGEGGVRVCICWWLCVCVCMILSWAVWRPGFHRRALIEHLINICHLEVILQSSLSRSLPGPQSISIWGYLNLYYTLRGPSLPSEDLKDCLRTFSTYFHKHNTCFIKIYKRPVDLGCRGTSEGEKRRDVWRLLEARKRKAISVSRFFWLFCKSWFYCCFSTLLSVCLLWV